MSSPVAYQEQLGAPEVVEVPGVLRRADWLVEAVPHELAAAFVEAAHYAQGAANTSVARHALRRPGSARIFGVAMWMPPTRAAAEAVAGDGWPGVLVLSRLVVAPEVPTNGASFLLGRSMRRLDRRRWPVLLTYADTAHGHTGAIYRATNWRCLGPTPAGDTWVGPNGEQRGRKRGGRNMTAKEMRAAGFERRPAAPKIRFVHP